jgi:NADH-quinone oxidoreductase subunit C
MEDFGSPALARLLAEQGRYLVASHAQHGDATAVVTRESVVKLLRFLRDDPACNFEMLSDLTAVDYLGEEPRFEVVYHLYSLEWRHRLRLKARVPEEDAVIASAVGVYASANWMEREVFDLYGIHFDGHPDLRRILLYEAFEGHPLRKDYPKERRQPLVGPRN